MSLTALTDEQYAHMKEAWRLFDTDGDGIVTPQDLQKILRSFGYEHSLVRSPRLCHLEARPRAFSSVADAVCQRFDRLQEELEVFFDDLPVCVEKDRCLDMPEFFLWTLKLAEVIEQVTCSVVVWSRVMWTSNRFRFTTIGI